MSPSLLAVNIPQMLEMHLILLVLFMDWKAWILNMPIDGLETVVISFLRTVLLYHFLRLNSSMLESTHVKLLYHLTTLLMDMRPEWTAIIYQ